MQGSLSEMIHYIQQGTRLHIGVLFIEGYGNQLCDLPREQRFHESPLCHAFKDYNKASYNRCYRCRNLALRKALRTKTPFAGWCVNGIYEYTHPVTVDGRVICVIFIGNMLQGEKSVQKINERIRTTDFPLDTLEQQFTYEDCVAIGNLLENYILFLLETGQPQPKTENPLIKNIKDYLDYNLEHNVALADVAEIFHYNERYLGRLFKKETGQCMHEYVTAQRIEATKELLCRTDHTVLDISEMVGFNNVTYFNLLFKKAVGLTPTQYRKEHQ